LSTVFAAVALLLILLFLAPLARYLPTAAMAGILFVVAWAWWMSNTFGEIVRASRQETLVLTVTFIATLTLDLEFAIYAGVLLSFLLYLNRTSRPGLEDVKPVSGPMASGFQRGHGPAGLSPAQDRAPEWLDLFWRGQPPARGAAAN